MSSWSKQRIQRWLRETEFNLYQGIPLPFGLEVPGPSREPTVKAACEGLDVRGKTVYVVGAHYGAVPNIFVDMGARRVLCIEARPQYQAIAETIIEIKGRQNQIRYAGGNCERTFPPTSFDIVTMFNVNHHFTRPINSIIRNARSATLAFLLEWATFETYNERHPDHQVDPEFMEQWPLMIGDKFGKWYASQKAIEQALREAGFRKFNYMPSPKASTRRIVQCLRS